MNNHGWVKKHRGIFEWNWFADDAVYRFFDCCILDANIDDGEFLGMKIPRGSFATSYRQMSLRFKMSQHKIERCINALKKTGEIKVKHTKKCTIITVVNYEKYQGVAVTATQPATQLNTQPATQPAINTKNKKNSKNSSSYSDSDSKSHQPKKGKKDDGNENGGNMNIWTD